jgi:hypothetical protein
MASNYTNLGVQLMTTGEKAGTWGTLTNTNWNIIEQIAGGWKDQDIAGGAQTTTLVKSDGSTGATLATRIWKLSGAITGNQIVTVPDSIENWWIVNNATTDGTDTYTVQVKTVSGTGITFAAGSAGRVTKLLYTDGTNVIDASADFGEVTLTGTQTLTNKTLTSPKIGTAILDTNGAELIKITATGSAENEFTIAAGASGAGPTLSSTGSSDTNIDINITPAGTGDVVLAADTTKVGDSGAAATLTSNGAGTLTVTTGGTENLILNTNSGTNSGTIEITDGAGGDITVTPSTTGSLKLAGTATQGGTFKIFEDTDLGSFHSGFTVGNLTEDIVYTLPLEDATTSGDALTSNAAGVLSWTTMSGGTSWQAVDTTGFTAVAGEGYFCNTTSAAFTATLPASPSLGDECTFVDYAGTFDTNNLTVGRNSEKINGSAADLTVSVERAAFTLVYTDGTQGWLLKDK